MSIARFIRAEPHTRYTVLTPSRRRIRILLRVANMVLLKGITAVDRRGVVSGRPRRRVRDIVEVLVGVLALVVRVSGVQRGAGVVVVRIRTMVAEGRMILVLGVVGHHDAGSGEDAAVSVVHLVVVESGRAGHGVVCAETGLATVDDDVEDDAGDVGGCADGGEGEEGLVDAANGDTGGVGPKGGVAGGGDRAGHAPAEKGEADQPDDEEDGVEGEGQARGEAGGAVGYGSEDVVKEGEDGGDQELCIGTVLVWVWLLSIGEVGNVPRGRPMVVCSCPWRGGR